MLRVRSLISGGLLLLGSVAGAQTPPNSNAPASDAPPVDPLALPGDFIDMPQGRQLTVNLGPPAGTRSTRPAVADATPSPGYTLALEAAQAAVASCAADGYVVAAAVTDAAGKLKVALAPEGTRSNGVNMALRKNATVVEFKMRTLALREKLPTDPSLMTRVKPNMALLPGGLPIMKGDVLVGAISTSGAAAYEEEKCAQAGIDRIQSRLK